MSLIKKINLKLRKFIRYNQSVLSLKKYKKDNDIKIYSDDLHCIRLKIEGKGNTVVIGKLAKGTNNINIKIVGNNNSIVISDGCYVSKFLDIYLGQNHYNFGSIENTKCNIGKNCSFESCRIVTFNSNAEINMGSNCMVSYDVSLYHTDGHPIMDYETKQIINKVNIMNIGDHVWLGKQSTILKNSNVPNNSIVGWQSVVSGKHYSDDQSGVVLAGNPAKIVKKGITWDSNGSNGYIQNL